MPKLYLGTREITPAFGSGNGGSYVAGNGIDITNDTISVDFNSVATAAQGSLADTALQPSALSGYATQTWVTNQGYTTNVGTVTSVNNVSPVNGNVSLSIPTVNNATLTIQKNGTTVNTFTANASSDITANITVPTNTNELTNGAGFITSSALSGYATETWVGNQGYLTQVTSSDVTTALGYTPYNSSNPAGYTSNVGTVTSVNNTSPDGNGNVSISIPAVDQTYDGTSSNAQSGTAVKSAIDSAISSVYKPAGSVAFASLPALSSSIEGYVYNVTDSFTTTSDFVEGAGKTYPANTNLVCIDVSGTYKWDVLSGFVDLSGYVPTTRKVNNKSLASDISLDASDVGAVASNTSITGATKCKITYDSKGLVTAGADLSSSDITTALGYTPYNSSNPNGYTSNTGTVTSVNNVSPVNGNVTISIPSEVTETTVSNWGFTKNVGTVTSVNNVSPVSGNVSLSIPTTVGSLSDVTITSATNGQALVYDSVEQIWKNGTVSGGATLTYDSTTETLTIT